LREAKGLDFPQYELISIRAYPRNPRSDPKYAVRERLLFPFAYFLFSPKKKVRASNKKTHSSCAMGILPMESRAGSPCHRGSVRAAKCLSGAQDVLVKVLDGAGLDREGVGADGLFAGGAAQRAGVLAVGGE